jgi:energy-coupling factor transporter transmembrane protein EcfT
MILLLATLAIRYVLAPGIPTLLQWGAYASRVLLSVLAPLAIILRFGMLPVQQSLYSCARFLPSRLRHPLRDVLVSTVYMIPALLALLKSVRDAQHIRYRRARRWFHKPVGELSRVVVTSVSRIPQQRGEAMVIRGIVAREENE